MRYKSSNRGGIQNMGRIWVGIRVSEETGIGVVQCSQRRYRGRGRNWGKKQQELTSESELEFEKKEGYKKAK